MAPTKQEREATIKALLRERKGYEERGLSGRVADVDAQLKVLGAEARKPSQRSEQRPAARSRSTKR